MSQSQDQVKKIQTFTGVVISAAPAKTLVVEVKTKKRHPKYHKGYTVSKKYYAHVETGEYEVGDTVVLAPSKPYSKLKKFVVLNKV